MFQLVKYSASLGSVTNADVTAANDTVLGTRNSHLIVTDPFRIIAAHGLGSLLSRLQFNNPQNIQYGVPHLWPLSVSATVEDLPPVIDFRPSPIPIPMNEEFTVGASTTAVGPSRVEVALWLATPGHSLALSQYHWKGIVRATVVIAAGAAGAWGVPVTIAMERDLLNGVYEVYGCEVVNANADVFQIRFPDMIAVNGKQLRPGGLCQNTAALEPWKVQRGEQGGLGIWGRFHTFTLPQMAMFGDAVGGTYEVRLHVGYISSNRADVFAVPTG